MFPMVGIYEDNNDKYPVAWGAHRGGEHSIHTFFGILVLGIRLLFLCGVVRLTVLI